MEKRLEKNLYTQISADAALKIMETLRKEGYEDLPRKYQDLKGATLVLTYQAADPTKVRPQVGEAIDWDKHELRVGDRVEHPKLSIDGRPQGTVTITRLLKSCPGFLYLRPDGIEDSGQSNKTWIFKGGAKVRPTIGTRLDFEKHTLEIGDYITEDRGSVYRVTSKERFDCPSYGARPGSPAYNIEYVSGSNSGETWAWLADFWTLTSAPLAHPALGEKIFFFKHELKIGDFIKGPYDSDVYEVIACRKNEYDVKNVVSGTVIQAYASDYWTRVERPAPKVVYPKVGQKIRWASGNDWQEGRLYEADPTKDSCGRGTFRYICDKASGCGVGMAGLLLNQDFEDGFATIIAD